MKIEEEEEEVLWPLAMASYHFSLTLKPHSAPLASTFAKHDEKVSSKVLPCSSWNVKTKETPKIDILFTIATFFRTKIVV